ncbi:MAG: hypothetical protein QOI20_330, partial [Acidimicrobiaceae bacterium]|nr:hypothetical protein [Acidimicrobiaceae bacterium]
MTRSTVCRVDHRRHDVRAMGLNGIDDIEVGDPDPVDGSVTLCVHFLGPVPVDVRPKDLCVDGGGQGAAVAIVSVRANPAVDEDDDDCLEVRLDRSGDASTYCLCLRELEGFDPRYACRSFTFTGHCDSPLDCLTVPACPPAAVDEPALDFLAKDYATFRRLALDRMSLLVPEWRERHVPDVAVTLVEALAYVGDQLSYYQDAVATEAYLETARRRISVRRHGRLVDYVLGEGANARAFVVMDVDAALDWPAADVVFLTRFPGSPPPGGPPLSAEEVPLPAGGAGAGGAGHRWFQPVGGGPSVVRARPEHNVIRFHTWGERECCLVAGATSAALVDEGLDLRPGDFLVLEEVRGARTGVPGDADPARRHVVRLSRVGERVEDVVEKAVVRQVEWCPEDALPFPFCLSAVGGEDCALLTDVTVARGNVVLVDDGATVVETLPAVPDDPMRRMCEGECQPVDEQEAGPPYTVVLDRPDVTFAAQPVAGASAPTCPPSAAALMAGADAHAEPQVVLRADAKGSPWTPRPDLLGAGPDERAFVVEMDEERRAHLRFGDGRMGARPEPGTVFTAEYRVGAGPPGNVGAE